MCTEGKLWTTVCKISKTTVNIKEDGKECVEFSSWKVGGLAHSQLKTVCVTRNFKKCWE